MTETRRGWAAMYVSEAGTVWAAAATRGYESAPRRTETVAGAPKSDLPGSADRSRAVRVSWWPRRFRPHDGIPTA